MSIFDRLNFKTQKMKKLKTTMKIFTLLSFLILQLNCSSSNNSDVPITPPIVVTNDVDFWLTKGNQTINLQKQTTVLGFGTAFNTYPNIEVNEALTYQTIDGFGYTLTGGSAQMINQLNATKKQELLSEIFGNTATSISVSYLRVSIGASDLNATAFTYNDLATGTDVNLTNFSIAADLNGVVAVLKEILLINPNIKIMATPWSAPAWMKTNNSLIGGSLQTQYYDAYANYFVKYLQAMSLQGITIDAITPQNEPENPFNNPSMLMNAQEQTNFIKTHLGPKFQMAGLSTKIVTFDHNCDNPSYPISILNDPAANPFVNGSAFHLYAGDISALSAVHDAHPNKDIYFTEQYTGSGGSFSGDLKWHLKNVIIGSMRNWSKNALEWNLANDASFGPHTVGGCDTCKGALTINGPDSYTKNVAYYIIAHASKFVPAGSVRIASNNAGNLFNVAFKTPTGKKVLIVLNDGATSAIFNIKQNGKWVTSTLDTGAVGTYVW
jgi:glucosylceramidase